MTIQDENITKNMTKPVFVECCGVTIMNLPKKIRGSRLFTVYQTHFRHCDIGSSNEYHRQPTIVLCVILNEKLTTAL